MHSKVHQSCCIKKRCAVGLKEDDLVCPIVFYQKAPIKHKFERRNLLYAGVCGRGCYRLLCRYLLRNSVGVHPLCFLKQRLKCETVLKPQT